MKPGKRPAFMAIAAPYVAECRKEEGCAFFEMNASADDPDVVVVTECFKDADAHTAHLKTPLFQAFWQELDGFCIAARFENIFARLVVPDSATFGVPRSPEVHY